MVGTPGEFLHLIVGQPDDDCPICRAHRVKSVEPEMRISGGGELRALPLSRVEMDLCDCELCRGARSARS